MADAAPSFTVGGYYRVPCLKTKPALASSTWKPVWGGAWVPITGPLHRDAEHINFPQAHWHVDLRFLAGSILRTLTAYGRTPYSIPLQMHPVEPQGGLMVENVFESFVVGGVESRLMKCKRLWPPYPRDKAKWLPALEKAFCASKMKGMVCPHRGIPLDGAEREGDVVTCPAHGLRWNVKTGELVPR